MTTIHLLGYGAAKGTTLLVLLWNLIEELRQQLPGMELVTAIPALRRDSGAMMEKPDSER